MKHTTFKLFIILTLCTFAFSNCSENRDINSNMSLSTIKDYSSTISQQRIAFAKNLISLINENEEIAEKITSECLKKFDGDNNVLCKDLFDVTMNISNRNLKISSFIDANFKSQRVRNVEDVDNFSNLLLSRDSLLQIYFYNVTGDSSSFKGIVVVPENVKERDRKDLLVINKDGSESYIRSDIDPQDNYLVISRNERTGSPELEAAYVSSNKQNVKTSSNGKSISIVRAKFKDITAKRAVEDWWGGEPEVRVNMVYALMDPITNKPIEARTSSFLYPGNWLKLGVFKNDVKWNNAPINFPFWHANEQNYGRRIIWVEEDGVSTEQTFSTVFKDENTNMTTTLSSKRPATNNDVTFSDSWIDFTSEAGILYWSLIEFEIAY